MEEELLEQKDEALKQVRKELESLLQERTAQLQAVEEEKKCRRIQVRKRRPLNAA